MPLSIKDPEADQLARKLAQRTGETITQAVITALRERLAREQQNERAIEDLVEDAMDIGRHCAALPLLDERSPDEILGYDEHGLPR
jgi:antitoxin VapB